MSPAYALKVLRDREALEERCRKLEALVRLGFEGDDDTGRNCCPWCHVYLSPPWGRGTHAPEGCAAVEALDEGVWSIKEGKEE
jgi:hypothetical protein